MADDKARTITLDDLITTATTSTLRTIRTQVPDLKGKFVPPKIWVGIWIDPTDILSKFDDVAGS
jgi:hypothetical protein